MFKKLTSKMKKDDGNATIILGILMIVVFIVVGGIMLDFTKAHHLKSSYIDAAKKSTQAATMEQDTRGYLTLNAVSTAVVTYEKVMRPSVINTDGYFSRCEDYDEGDVTLKVIMSKGSSKNGPSSTFLIERNLIKNDTNNQVSAQKIINQIQGRANEVRTGRYTSIQLEIVEGTENSVLPVGFKIAKSGPRTQQEEEKIANMKCQKLGISAKASTFIGDKENKYD